MSEPILERDDEISKLGDKDLGWVGVDRNAPEVLALRDHLDANNGIKGLEIVSPSDVARATELFHRDGFVVVSDALTVDQLDFLRAGCLEEVREMMAMDKNRRGNRGSHRYSFGSASLTGQLMHRPEWAMLVDLPTITPIITSIFGAPTYMCRGGGGDFCLPGAVEYQRLHSDMGDRRVRGDRVSGSFFDHRGMLTYSDLPVPSVVCNFLTVDFTKLNGPTRQIPGTQHARDPFPTITDEPEWMKLSTICPVPAGGVLIRDIRAWHGGTPNLSDEVRSIPNMQYWAPWYREPTIPCVPREIYDGLSDHGKKLCEYIVADKGDVLEAGYRKDLGKTPRLMRPEFQDESS